jgi:hypothetical protein
MKYVLLLLALLPHKLNDITSGEWTHDLLTFVQSLQYNI